MTVAPDPANLTDIPDGLVYGYVADRIILGVADSSDTNRLPNAVAAQGTIEFLALVKVLYVPATHPVSIMKKPIICSLDKDGYLIDPQGLKGVFLFEGPWRVTYNLDGVEVETHDIQVEGTHTLVAPLYLASWRTVPGEVIIPTQYDELMSRVNSSVKTDGSINKIVSITQAEYNLLSPPDPMTLYVITV